MVNIISLIIFKRIKYWLKKLFISWRGGVGIIRRWLLFVELSFFFPFFVQMIATCKEEMKKSDLLEEDVVFLVR